jgi:hypothetical protein
MANTILYLGTPNLDPLIKQVCFSLLEKMDKPIVRMEQPPEWELSGLSMYKQIKKGLEQVHTKWVAIAEHDCLYTGEHFDFTPPDDRYFWYNLNNWLVQYKNPKHPEYDGMYSYVPNRRVQSQLICRADMLREVTEAQIRVVERPDWFRDNKLIGEPGTIGIKALRMTTGDTHQWIKDYLIGYQARDFRTEIPNVDIRHDTNLTGPRRGTNRTFELSTWGRFDLKMV